MHILLCCAHIPVYIIFGISGSVQREGRDQLGRGRGGVEVLPQAAHFHKAARTLRRVPVLQFDFYQIVVNVHLALIFRHASQINEMSPVIRI